VSCRWTGSVDANTKACSLPFDRKSWRYQKPDDPLFKAP
jgi:hypothetical protein